MILDDCTVYVFVRQDIPLAQQLVQSLHALLGMNNSFLCPRDGTPSMIVIGVPHPVALTRVREKLLKHGIAHCAFIDPDTRELGVTAVATVPLSTETKAPLENYRLWKYSPGAPQGACGVTPDGRANAAVAQLREHSEFNRGVTGENPVSGSIPCE